MSLTKTVHLKNTVHLAESPNILGLFSRAVLPKIIGKSVIIPELSVDLKGLKPDSKLLKEYIRICGFESKAHLPATFPHVMAFPLQMKLMTDSKFPLSLLGLIHIKNTITQYRPLNTNELLDMECFLSTGRYSSIGTQFDIITKAYVGGIKVWEEVATILHRTGKKISKGKKTHSELPNYPNNEVWALPPKLGRQYAKVSNDFNLIHLYDWSAKLFGFFYRF